MSLMKRISLIFRSKANKALDRAEDPRETLDYSYQRQLDLLVEGAPRRGRRGHQPQAASSSRSNQLEQQSAKLQAQAEKALAMGREDLAREALTRKSGLPRRSPTSRPSTPSSRARRRSSPSPSSGCRRRSRRSAPARRRSRRRTPPPRRRPASTRRCPGIGEEMGDVGLAIQRAEDKTAQMQARAGAIDELIASGALDDASAIGSGDDITRELDAMSSAGRRRGRAGPAQGRAPRRPAGGIEAAPRPGEILDAEPEKHAESAADARASRPMIVRILGEGQYDVADDALDRLNELDTALEAAVEAGDEAALRAPRSTRCSTASDGRGRRTPPTASTSPT